MNVADRHVHVPRACADPADEAHSGGRVERQADGAILAHFGVVPGLRGTGLGRHFLHRALSAVWRPGLTIRLDTGTNDDPRAVRVYRDAGFAVTAVGLTEFPD